MCEDKSIFSVLDGHVFWTSIPTRFGDKKREAYFAVDSLRGWNQSYCFCMVSRLGFS